MAPREISWLDYYQAVKRGDLRAVKRSRKNFRLPLTLNASALQLAAAFGHLELVRYFLSQCTEKYDRQIILHAAECADYACAELLLDHVKPLQKPEIDDFVVSMLQRGNLECVGLIDWRQLGPFGVDLVRSLATVALGSGSVESIKFVYELYKLSDLPEDAVTEELELEFLIAYHERKPFADYVEYEELYAITILDCDGFEHRLHDMGGNWSPMDIAACFGDLKMLKFVLHQTIHERSKDEKDDIAEMPEQNINGDEELNVDREDDFDVKREDIEDDQLLKDLEMALKLALNHNRLDVVRYLVETGLVEPSLPYTYADFRVNETFEYLWQKTKHLARQSVRGLPFELKRGWTTCRRFKTCNVNYDARKHVAFTGPYGSRKTILETEAHFKRLLEIGDEISDGGEYVNIFLEMLAQQNVEAALLLKDRVGKFSCTDDSVSSSNYHRYLKKALRCYSRDGTEVLPSPVIVEMALPALNNDGAALLSEKIEMEMMFSALNNGDYVRCSCACGRICPMAFILKRPKESKYQCRTRVYANQPLEFLIQGTDAIMDLVVKHGCRKPELVFKTIFAFFYYRDQIQPLFAARLLTLLRSCKLKTKWSHVDLKFCATWFVRDGDWRDNNHLKEWNQADLFLTEFLLALSAQETKTVEGGCFLVYMLDPPARTDHFVNCINQTRLKISDEKMDEVMGLEKPSARFWELYKSRESRIPSLQSLCRLKLHKYSLKLATKKQRRFASSRNILRNFSRHLPPILGQFLLYSDVYQTLEAVEEELKAEQAGQHKKRFVDRVFNREEEDENFYNFPDSDESDESYGSDCSDESEDSDDGDERELADDLCAMS